MRCRDDHQEAYLYHSLFLGVERFPKKNVDPTQQWRVSTVKRSGVISIFYPWGIRAKGVRNRKTTFLHQCTRNRFPKPYLLQPSPATTGEGFHFPAPKAEPLPLASQSRFVLGLSGQASTSGRYFRKATKRPFISTFPRKRVDLFERELIQSCM